MEHHDRSMSRASSSYDAVINVKCSAAEKRLLIRRARDADLPLVDYIRGRVLAEAGCEKQILCYLVEELASVAEDNRRAGTGPVAEAEEGCSESASAQRDRIVREVRESLTQEEIARLAEFFKPAFDAGLWSEPSDASQRKES